MRSHQQFVIDLDSAQALVRATIAAGRAAGVPCSVAVVGPTMELIAFGRDDGATPHSVESSRRKANTAASTRRASGWMSDALALALPLATGLRTTDIRGGLPIEVDGRVVGGLGVAGGTPEQDADVAAAGLRDVDTDRAAGTSAAAKKEHE